MESKSKYRIMESYQISQKGSDQYQTRENRHAGKNGKHSGYNKVARFSLATNVFFKNSKGEKQKETNWHNIVAWGKTAEIVEKYASKGKEIAVTGKLKTRSYSTDDGIQRFVTEVEAREILLMGSK